ncbi:hypothetical protein K2173_026962 [Erythroxylum novogranatense]|uniref:PARP n=1 Tax=Erythroxylum novogranatense TaxID=1862640 RepID=A0AAV8U075_9ROSI|nr:hypothetical protein K2173_026962 [Erythroxylum novogranatense]
MNHSPILLRNANCIIHDAASNSLSDNSLDKPNNKETRSLDTGHDPDSFVSDCESCSSSDGSSYFQDFSGGLVRLCEGDRAHDLIKRKFLSSLGLLGTQTRVVAIRRNIYSGVMSQAKIQSFQIFTKAVEKKNSDDANVKYAWYGNTRSAICQVLKHGFGPQLTDNNGIYGCGLYLSPDNCPLECVKNLKVGGDGLRHLLLCRVILGKAEVVNPGSDQCHPSSEEFDSGVDNLSDPKKYIVWSTHMNTHVLPEFLISFKAPPSLRGYFRVHEPLRKPTSPWMPLQTLIDALSKFLPPTTMRLISKHYSEQREKKISREELVRRLRQIAGDRLLIAAIKSFATKALRMNRLCMRMKRTMLLTGQLDGLNNMNDFSEGLGTKEWNNNKK